MTSPLTLPVRAAPPEPPPFPLLGALAPLLVAAVLFAATRSSAVLLFAVFSPVLAVAGVVDGRLQMRRRRRRDERSHADALDALEREADRRLAARSAELRRRHAGSPMLVGSPADWAALPPSGELVLGTADQPADALVTGRASTERERALLARAARADSAPVVVAVEARIAVLGDAAAAGAVARSIAVQRARGEGRAALPAVVARLDQVEGAEVVLAVDSVASARIVHAHGRHAPLAGLVIRADLVTEQSLARVTLALTTRVGSTPPVLTDLLEHPAERRGLVARFAVDGAGPIDIDLVEDGPHAIVGGTTGSGKSALLTAWMLALAAAHPPDAVNLLLIDCKGGAAFDPLAALPHVVGVVTDLDADGADRAVSSLRAELVRRERMLRAARAADVAATDLPRLVIVVDEFRAMIAARPELGTIFVDVAARGRSLGVHLILCTQRPNGSVRDELMTNCGLRIALRVNDVADSIAVTGVDWAARITRQELGRGVLATAGEPATAITIARVEPAAVADAVRAIVHRYPGGTPTPVWLPPLPTTLPLAALLRSPESADRRAGDVLLGRLDLPDEQRQPVCAWNPVAQPRLLVLGDAGSGRSNALAVIAAQLDIDVLSADVATAWDQLHVDDRPLAIDGLERLLDELGPHHAQATLDALAVRLRRPGSVPTVLAIRGPSGWGGAALRPLVGLFDTRLLLRLGHDDHLSQGGPRSLWSTSMPPGAGWWQGDRVQLALAETPLAVRPADPTPLLAVSGALLVVATASPQRRADELRAAGYRVVPPDQLAGSSDADADAVVAAPDVWQANWGLLARLRQTGTVVVDGLTAMEYRSMTGRDRAQPPVSHPLDVVIVPSEGEPRRARIPPAAETRSDIDARAVSSSR